MFTSCENPFSEKKLDLNTIENEEIVVEKYSVSEITTVHQFIDITNKRWDKVERILEANDNSIDSIFIKQDTLFLRKASKEPVIYDLSAIKFGYKVVLLEPKND